MSLLDYEYKPDPSPFEPYLRPGEMMLWKGQPDEVVYNTSSNRAGLLFAGLLLLACIASWRFGRAALAAAAPVLVPAFAVYQRRRLVWRRAQNVTYGVTEDRLLVHMGWRRPQFFAYELAETPFRQIVSWKKGPHWGLKEYGHILFAGERVASLWDRVALPDPRAHARGPAFVTVRDPRVVYRVVEDARALPRLRFRPDEMIFDMPGEGEMSFKMPGEDEMSFRMPGEDEDPGSAS